MCGRYTLTLSIDALRAVFPDVGFNIPEITSSFNVAPSQLVPVIRRTPEGNLQADLLKWGLIPSWAKDPKIGYKLINARAESLVDKPSFRSAFKYRRCLIPADGFFEWLIIKETNARLPIYSKFKTADVFAFAGLWENWKSPVGEYVRSATIITGPPNELVNKFHDRMPVILSREKYQTWLDPTTDQGELLSLLKPYPAEEMICYPVTPKVNSARYEGSDTTMPL